MDRKAVGLKDRMSGLKMKQALSSLADPV